jgi:hypothetical protein
MLRAISSKYTSTPPVRDAAAVLVQIHDRYTVSIRHALTTAQQFVHYMQGLGNIASHETKTAVPV